jgi:hypothetical protein
MYQSFEEVRKDVAFPPSVRDGGWLGDVYQIYDTNDRMAIVEAASNVPSIIWAEEGFLDQEFYDSQDELARQMREDMAAEEFDSIPGFSHEEAQAYLAGQIPQEEPFIDVDPVVEHSATDPTEDVETETMEEFVENLGLEPESEPHQYRVPSEQAAESLRVQLETLSMLVNNGVISEIEFYQASEQAVSRFRETYNFNNIPVLFNWDQVQTITFQMRVEDMF